MSVTEDFVTTPTTDTCGGLSGASLQRRINACNGLTAGTGCGRIDESSRSSERGEGKDWDTDTSVAWIVRLFFGCSDWNQG